jgi:hypothetical protein
VKLDNDGLSVWWGTPDAPGLPARISRGNPATLTIGVAPIRREVTVTLHYQADGGPPHVVPTWLAATDHVRGAQYFRARLPEMLDTGCFRYVPVVKWMGFQAPPVPDIWRHASRFDVVDRPVAISAPDVPEGGCGRFTPELEFIAAITDRFAKNPDIIGETPLGLRINYYVDGGEARGPRLNGRILPRGADFLTIRTDGIAAIRVRAAIATHDGALISADYYGKIDLGPDGYGRAVSGVFPDIAALQLSAVFASSAPAYAWMNRTHFVGVGQVHLSHAVVHCDLLALKNAPVEEL